MKDSMKRKIVPSYTICLKLLKILKQENGALARKFMRVIFDSS